METTDSEVSDNTDLYMNKQEMRLSKKNRREAKKKEPKFWESEYFKQKRHLKTHMPQPEFK